MLLLDQTGEIENHWPAIDDDADLPEQGYVLVTPARLDAALARKGLHIGVAIPNDAPPEALVPHFDRVGLIAVTFPSFADGRGFSIAARLRALGFAGRLRAAGPVIADQFAYLLSCGFDEVAVPDTVALRQPVQHWTRQLDLISLGYQRGRSGKQSILDQRRARHD